MLRQHWGSIGLAVASAVAILVYVLLLGGLQRRRFEREAAARGTALDPAPGMLSIRLAFAAAIAIGAGLGFRMVLISFCWRS